MSISGRRGDVGVAVPSEVHRRARRSAPWPRASTIRMPKPAGPGPRPGRGRGTTSSLLRAAGRSRRRSTHSTRRGSCRPPLPVHGLVVEADVVGRRTDPRPGHVRGGDGWADDERDERDRHNHEGRGRQPRPRPCSCVASTAPAMVSTRAATARTTVAARVASGPPLARCGVNPTATAKAGRPASTARRPCPPRREVTVRERRRSRRAGDDDDSRQPPPSATRRTRRAGPSAKPAARVAVCRRVGRRGGQTGGSAPSATLCSCELRIMTTSLAPYCTIAHNRSERPEAKVPHSTVQQPVSGLLASTVKNGLLRTLW